MARADTRATVLQSEADSMSAETLGMLMVPSIAMAVRVAAAGREGPRCSTAGLDSAAMRSAGASAAAIGSGVRFAATCRVPDCTAMKRWLSSCRRRGQLSRVCVKQELKGQFQGHNLLPAAGCFRTDQFSPRQLQQASQIVGLPVVGYEHLITDSLVELVNRRSEQLLGASDRLVAGDGSELGPAAASELRLVGGRGGGDGLVRRRECRQSAVLARPRPLHLALRPLHLALRPLHGRALCAQLLRPLLDESRAVQAQVGAGAGSSVDLLGCPLCHFSAEQLLLKRVLVRVALHRSRPPGHSSVCDCWCMHV